MVKIPRFRILAAVSLPLWGCAALAADPGDLESSYRFLVGDWATERGVLYTLHAGSESELRLPLSYRDSAAYWGEYVCGGARTACAVTNTYNPLDYTLAPPRGPAGELQAERVFVHNGSSIYDAATWQIAVVLGEVVNRFGNPTGQSAYALASHEGRWLQPEPGAGALAAFHYNGRTLDAGERAYAFRMRSPHWLVPDPLAGTRFDAWISASALPAGNPKYQRGRVTWSDWKPVTGENAWAYLLGPLQAAWIHYVRGQQHGYVPFHEPAVQDALAMLPTFALLQSPTGGVYYAPAAVAGSAPGAAADPHAVSVENNFSLYAGLRLLERILREARTADTVLAATDQQRIDAALATMHTLIDGGAARDGRTTEGLLAFFKTRAWRDGEFVQGGLANDPRQAADWAPFLASRAIDVNTWGIAALGAAQVDQWFGYGAAFRNWQQVKAWGAYGVGATLWGVGYSDQDGNGRDADGKYRQGILSAEWTAGAINMVRNMIHHYGTRAAAPAQRRAARDYLRTLMADEQAMLAALPALRIDNYAGIGFPGTPANYAGLVGEAARPYLYASKRYRIPFGWYANPLPSTCATAWVIMLADHFDPFGYAGQPN